MKQQNNQDGTTAKSKYESLKSIRQNVENRAETYANWTIPNIFPDTSSQDSDSLTKFLNSIGAEALNNLTNKLLLALFSPGTPFFRIELTPEAKNNAMQALGLEQEVELDVILSRIEKECMKQLGRKGLRSAMFSTIQQIVVTGNALVYYPPENTDIVVYTLRDFVLERDSYGIVQQIIIQDKRVFKTLPDDTKQMLLKGKSYKDDDEVSYYVWIKKEGTKYYLDQYLEDILLTDEETRGIYTEDNLPYFPVAWRLARGHNYGTSLVEEYAGDFKALEILVESFVKGLAVAADLKQLVNPSGLTDIDDLVSSEFGAYVLGRAEDITVPQSNKGADYQLLYQGIEMFTTRIARAFLLSNMVTRNAERVTAFEIQQQINELETALGGVYTRLAAALQQPLATLSMKEINSELTPLNGVEPVVITGIDAISRFNEMSNVQLWLQDLGMLNSLPQPALQALNLVQLGSYMGSSRGVEVDKFVKSEEQIQAEQEAAMQQQMQMQGQEAMQGAMAETINQ